MNKPPIERHREAAKRVIETPDYPWHKRQTRLHDLVEKYGLEKVSLTTGFTIKSIRAYMSYKPFDLPENSNAINESRLIKAEQELQK